MNTLYLMCGLTFSGKSTLAKRIVQHLSCSYISLDEINEQRGVGFGGDGLPTDEWQKTHHVALQMLDKLMLSGQDAVLDDTNCFRWLRDRFRSVATRHGYETKVIYLSAPLSQIKERMQKNKQIRTRHGVNEEVFAASVQAFEYPQRDEDVLAYKSNENLERWMQKHIPSIR